MYCTQMSPSQHSTLSCLLLRLSLRVRIFLWILLLNPVKLIINFFPSNYSTATRQKTVTRYLQTLHGVRVVTSISFDVDHSILQHLRTVRSGERDHQIDGWVATRHVSFFFYFLKRPCTWFIWCESVFISVEIFEGPFFQGLLSQTARQRQTKDEEGKNQKENSTSL